MTEIEVLKEWVLSQKSKKAKWYEKNVLRQNLSVFEKDNLKKVYGKLQVLGEIETKINKILKRKSGEVRQ